MRVVVTGGAGFIGRALCRALVATGHQPLVLSRQPARAGQALEAGVRAVEYEPERAETIVDHLIGQEAVVHLAGESIAAGRWTAEQKARIRDSRVLGTRALVEAMRRSTGGPRVLLSASASGYYGPRGVEPVDESTPPGNDFLAQTCQAWEAEAREAESFGARVVVVRTGVVLGPGSEALKKLALPFKLFVGGPLGSGRQGFPWVHVDDVVGVYSWALENSQVSGAVNATGPEMLDNRAFCQALGRVLGRPCWAPVPGPILRIALGEMADALLLQGQKVLPKRTEELGYGFRYRTAEAALRASFGLAP
jgi:uncharacterized protein (TIGR01777 family)